MAIPRRCYCVHGDLTAFSPRLYGASMAFSRRVSHLIELLGRLQGIFAAFMAIAWSFYVAFAKRFLGVNCARVEPLPRPMTFSDKNTK